VGLPRVRNCVFWTLLCRSDLRDGEGQQSFAACADISRGFGTFDHGEDSRVVAARARSRGIARLRISGRIEILRDFAHPRRFQLKSCVAPVAHVVVTAFRFARIKDVGRAALGTSYRNGCKRHWLSAWRNGLMLSRRRPVAASQTSANLFCRSAGRSLWAMASRGHTRQIRTTLLSPCQPSRED